MNKAEDRALEAFPLKIDGDSRGSYDLNVVKRIIYQQGYEQAEKDLELTWEDVKEICVQSVLVEIDLGRLVSDERHYTEVLKRFKDFKGRKQQ